MNSLNSRTALLLSSVTGAAAFIYSIHRLYRAISTPLSSNIPTVIPSPRTALLPHLSEGEIKSLPYPPDVLPGVRDVETHYGSIRIYEWGPEDGRKVLLVHGISTPCISLAGIAEKLVNEGCRVMLFDLFGRGYSGSPTSLPHDIRLYTSQIFLVLASSSLSWTGKSPTSTAPSRFTFVGYSLGGCIATHFTATFPHLVSNLVLVAPAGLIREKHVGWQSRLLYSSYGGLIPESWVEGVVANRLRGGPTGATAVSPKKLASAGAMTGEKGIAAQNHTPYEEKPMVPHSVLLALRRMLRARQQQNHRTALPSSTTDKTVFSSAVAPIAAEVANTTPTSTINSSSASHSAAPSTSSFDNAILFPDRPTVFVAATVTWQLTHHPGFIPAFISCIRNCPIYGQYDIWRTIGVRLAAVRTRGKTWPDERADGDAKPGLESKVLVVLGKTDPIIIADELEEDGVKAIGEQNVEFVEVEAGHEAPITRSREIVEAMQRMWERRLRDT